MADTDFDLSSRIFDPMVADFALQHDFRERFYHALLQIIDVARGDATMSIEKRYGAIVEIAIEALDHDSIQQWLADNRPLPWLDEELGAPAEELSKAVIQVLLDSQVE